VLAPARTIEAIAGTRQQFECRSKIGREILACAGQGDAPARTMKQFGAEVRFKLADVAADRGVRDVQLGRRERETHVPGCGFESA